MQPGQVSVWVPILVGIIGLISVVAGQFVNAWREDRRWKREQQRDDIRWKQERDRERDKLAHDSMIDWRERRLNVYSEYLQLILDTMHTAREYYRTQDHEAMHTIRSQWSKQHVTADQVAQTVRLIASELVVAQVRHNPLILAPPSPIIPRQDSEPAETETVSIQGREMHKKVHEIGRHYFQLLDLMRKELGANPLTSGQ